MRISVFFMLGILFRCFLGYFFQILFFDEDLLLQCADVVVVLLVGGDGVVGFRERL